MASKRYEEKYRDYPPVPMQVRTGCGICGRKGRHAHTRADWQEALDSVGNSVTEKEKGKP